MDDMQALLDKQLAEVPRLLLRNIVAKKLRSAGIASTPDLADQLIDHALSGNPEPFRCDDKSNDDSKVTLSFSDEDIADAEQKLSRLLSLLPNIIENTSMRIARALLPALKKRWIEEYSLQLKEQCDFRERLENRWGKALGAMRLLLTICREIGQDAAVSRPLLQTHLHNVLTRLHVRACQVTAEIIVLLENGYADGAMARWRTLHEISIVMVLIKDHGETLAERYTAHQAVEAKSGKDQYHRCHVQLGCEPIDDKTCLEIDDACERALARYGKDFGGPYGWAAGYVPKGKRQLGLGDLEAAAGRGAFASHYKLASYNVHAGPHALFFRLGLLGESKLLAGASNAGLTEPGQNTAVSLTLISVLLIGETPGLDDVIAMKLLQLLGREIPNLFAKAAQRLQADHLRHLAATKI
jgi:hypothetical protein